MKKYTILFETIYELWEFEKDVHAQFVKINLPNKTLTCHCYAIDIELAILKYHATVIDSEQIPVFKE